MSNIVAGIGRGQLLTLDEYKEKKQKIYQRYQSAFADVPEIRMNPLNLDGEANNWLSCITLEPDCIKRGITPLTIMETLEKENIESRPIWKPMELQPVFSDNDFIQVESNNGKSIGADIFDRGVCLPSDIKNTDEEMERVIQLVKTLFR